jgi:hypothetical protein
VASDERETQQHELHNMNVSAVPGPRGEPSRPRPVATGREAEAAPGQRPTRPTAIAGIVDLANEELTTSFPKEPWEPRGFVVNCAIIAPQQRQQ